MDGARSRLLGLAILALVLAGLPLTFTNSFWYDVAIHSGISAIVCVGLNLLIGYAGQISLGHAAFFGIGAYASAILTGSWRWPAELALLAGLALSGGLALLVARPILALRGHYLAMATLGLGIIVSILLNQEIRLTGGPDGMPVPGLVLFGFPVRGPLVWYALVAVSLFIVTLLALHLVDSPIGRALRAVHGSELAARACGVDSTRLKVLVFVLSAMIASYAGSLFAHFSGWLTPAEAEFMRSIEFVTMVVLGGMASTFGAIVGAVVLTALPQFLTVFHDYEHVVLGLALVLGMIFLPRGVVPELARRLGWRAL
ncbi:High-affinity branched-chain amino acid transport system permease protein LivH [bacterium HR40]|nr:High-affinity branched-chain amino acid transport system permease protein LivH [bacterium HR40]